MDSNRRRLERYAGIRKEGENVRYKLDASGYIFAVAFNSYLDSCVEYTGEVPSGYKSLDDWASRACIQAYYIDGKGNLVIDFDREAELKNKQEQEAIDYSPVLRKDIYDTEGAIEEQYMREIATGKVVILQNIKTIAPKVKITGIQPGYNKFSIYAQGKNMLPCICDSCVISGVTFTKNISGSITVLGTAKQNIEYVIADGGNSPVFALKANSDYYLNLGGLECELIYFDGETTAQQYIGASGLLNLPHHIEVTKVVLRIRSGETLNKTFYPQLEYGNQFTSYEAHVIKSLEIDIEEMENELVIPADDLYASDELYPGTYPQNINYILVGDGKISVAIDNRLRVLKNGGMGLFSKYNTIYATKDLDLEVEYSANFLLVDSLAFLQGKATTTKRFKILEDGSIEANNGYFSGRIEANEGYFKGTVQWEGIKDENGNPVETVVTKITKNTVTTAYVNALNVKAGSVDAESITGTYIRGKYISGSTIDGGEIKGSKITGGELSIGGYGSYVTIDTFGKAELKSLKVWDAEIYTGKIGGLTINNYGLCYGKTSFSKWGSGIYVGPDGIAVGDNNFSVSSSGDVYIGSLGGISLSSSASVDFGSTAYARLTSSGLYLDSALSYTLTRDGLKMGSTTVSSNLIKFDTSGTIRAGYNDVIKIGSYIEVPVNIRLGGSYSTVGFFGSAGKSKQSISTLSTYSPTISDVANKLNSLISALNSYNLV